MTPTQATQVARFLDELSDAVYLDEYRIAQALEAESDSVNDLGFLDGDLFCCVCHEQCEIEDFDDSSMACRECVRECGE